MDRVPFERVERIKRALPDELLPGLIAVFSKAFSDDLLLVYLGPARGARPPHRMAITVDDLPGADLMEYDGPTLGLPSVDLIRSDIPTKGPHFVRLDRVLRDRGQVTFLHKTWAEFADYLSRNFDEIMANSPNDAFRHRAMAEITAMSTPDRIACLPPAQLRGMVAFVPARNDAIHLGAASLDSMSDSGVRPAETFVALEEVRPLIEASHPGQLDNRYPIELRTSLRRAHLDAELAETLRLLAQAFHRRWNDTGAQADGERAYAIALELRLTQSDVDDLIAVLPDGDFDAFLNGGAGTYVYRRPLEGSRGRSSNGVRRRSLDDAREELAQAASPVVFSLLPLRGLLGSDGGGRFWSDLGPVLRKVGRTEILARNAWLLVQDLLDAPRDRREQFQVSLESLFETMTHCCAIFSLTDPWRTRQGRRNEWLLESYATLHRVLGMLVQTTDGPRRSYYLALDHWYGCALKAGTEIRVTLEQMAAELNARPHKTMHRDRQDTEIAELVKSLQELGNALLDLMRGGGRAEAYEELIKLAAESFPQVVSRATEMARPMELLSVPFHESFQHYAAIGDTVRRTKAAHIPVRDKIERLMACGDRLSNGRRLIFAPYHQDRILAFLYDRAIDETQELVRRLRGGASLEVELKTHAIAPHQHDSGIVFSVTNVGSVEAREVEVELDISDAFELLDQSFKQTLSRLAPEEEHRFRFSVRSLTGDDAFPIRCMVSCADAAQERQQRTLEFVMRVSGLESGPFRKKPNPYVFGVPLQKHRQFYGRRSELEQLLGHLAIRGPQNILLRGARRTGKTSLLYMVRAVLTDTDGRSGVRSWFELPQTWHEALDSTAPVILDLQAIDWPDGIPTPTSFHHAVLAALRNVGLRCKLSDMLLDEPWVTSTQFVKALEAVVREARGIRPVMLVDEFDILDRMAEKSSFYGPLRAAISAVQGVTWIVASALGLYNEVRDYESPLFNVFKIIPLARLEPDAARRLVLGPWGQDRGTALVFADDAVDAIVEEAGRYPYFIQLVCSEVVDHVNRRTHTNFVQYKTVLHVIERHMLNEGSAASEHFAYLWDRAGGIGRLILLALLHHPGALRHDELKNAMLLRLLDQAPASRARAASAFDDSLQRLLVVDAVRKVPGGGYAFGIPLFRRLLLKRHEREDLLQAAYQTLKAEDSRGVGRG